MNKESASVCQKKRKKKKKNWVKEVSAKHIYKMLSTGQVQIDHFLMGPKISIHTHILHSSSGMLRGHGIILSSLPTKPHYSSFQASHKA